MYTEYGQKGGQTRLMNVSGVVAVCVFLFSCQQPTPQTGTPATPPSAGADSTLSDEMQDAAFRLNQQGDTATARGQYPEAIAFYQQSMDSAALQADSFRYYDAKLDLACVHERLSEFPRAIEIGKEVLEAFLRSGDSSRIGRTYATLASFYGSAHMEPEFLEAARKGFDLVKTHGSLIERCAAYNQMAFTYSGAGRWSEALPLLDSALLFMRMSGVVDNITSMYLNLGDCHRNLGHWNEARRYLQDCADLTDSLQQTHVHAVALLRLSQVAEATGDLAGALQYLKQSKALKDSIFTAEKIRGLQELEVHYETKEKEQQIVLLLASHASERARRNLALALLAFTIIVSAILLFFWRAKIRFTRRELDNHRQHLQTYTQMLVLKNARLAEVEAQLNAPENQGAQTEPQSPQAEPARTEKTRETDKPFFGNDLLNRNILTDADWAAFKEYFERGHPGYILRLRKSFPDLTDAEERLFLLLKLNLSSREAAAMQGISLESIKKNRYRLRKRLGLEQDEGLEQFIRVF